MAAYEWKDDWAIGNTMIDMEHKELVRTVNELLEACSCGHGKDSINKIMKFLIDYTVKHFANEEALQ